MANSDFDFSPSGLQNKLMTYLESLDYFLFNERDLQVYLTVCLSKEPGIKVHTEYHLPHEINKEFDKEYAIWDTETPSIDIVIEKGGEFLAIELKYKLKDINGKISRFGQETGEIAIVTNQSAENEARYDFWKDVKRIELLSEHYDHVKGGVSLFLTNQASYLNTKSECKYSAFGFQGKEAGPLEWHYKNDKEKIPGEKYKYHTVNGHRVKKEVLEGLKKLIGDYYYVRPNFILKQPYEGKWLYGEKNPKLINIGAKNHKFYCFAVAVSKKSRSKID